MTPAVVLIAALLVQAGGFGQETETAGDAELPRASISGSVTRAGTGEPLPGAIVELTLETSETVRRQNGPPAIRATTDAQGRFELREAEPSEYRLAVYATGFVRQEYGQVRHGLEGTTLELGPAQQIDVDFSLTPTATIWGRVYSQAGEPLPNVAVQLLRPEYQPDGTRFLRAVQGGLTNDLGEYRLFWMTPGAYLISAGVSGPLNGGLEMIPNLAPPEITTTTYYPGVLDDNEATPVRVLDGDLLGGIDFTIVPTPTVAVRGRLVSAVPGYPPTRSFLFSSRDPGSGGMQFIRTGDDGAFEITGVAPGAYALTGGLQDAVNGDRMSRSLTMDIPNRDVDDLVFVIGGGVDVPVRVYLEDDGNVEAPIDPTTLNLTLSGEAGGYEAAEPSPVEWAYLFQSVPPGRHRLRIANLTSDYFLKRVLYGGEEISDDTIEVSDETSTLDVLLSARGGQAEGTATDLNGNPIVGAQIVLIPDEPLRDIPRLYKTATADEGGRYLIERIPPGAYKLLAFEYLEPFGYFNPELQRRFELRGESLEVEDGSLMNLDLQVIPETELP